MRAALLLLGLLGSASAFLAPATPSLGLRAAPATAKLHVGARSPLLGGAPTLRQARLAAVNRAGVQMKVDLTTAKVMPYSLSAMHVHHRRCQREMMGRTFQSRPCLCVWIWK